MQRYFNDAQDLIEEEEEDNNTQKDIEEIKEHLANQDEK